MARSHGIVWTPELENEIVRLHDEERRSWREVAEILGMANADVPRIRYSRVKTGSGRGGGGGSQYVPKEKPVVGQPRKTPEPLEYEIQARFIESEYTFDGNTYYFPVNKNIIKIPRETWERIVAEYSEAGANQTQAEIAMEIGMHKKALEACLKKYGHFKARPPVTREALSNAQTPEELEPLYEKAIEVREARFQRGLNARRLRELESSNKALLTRLHFKQGERDQLMQSIGEVFGADGALAALGGDVEKIVPMEGKPYTLHLPFFDAHFGLKVFGDSGWLKDYDTDMAAEYVVAACRKTAEYIAAQPGQCKKIRITNGGDVFHAMEQRTRGGTPLERDRPDKAVYKIALEAFVKGIELLRQVAEVIEYDGMPGNHDGIHEWFLRVGIGLYFRNCGDVDVNEHEHKRTWFMEGDSLHVFDHGEQFARFDPTRMTKAELCARMTGKPFHAAERIYFYVGHTHHRETKSHGAHLELIRVNTFAHASDYEEGLVFYKGEPEVSLYRLDGRGRIASEERLYMPELSHTLDNVNFAGQ